MIRKIKDLSASGQVFFYVESEADSTEAFSRATGAPKGAGFRFRHVFFTATGLRSLSCDYSKTTTPFCMGTVDFEC